MVNGGLSLNGELWSERWSVPAHSAAAAAAIAWLTNYGS